jgi:hypothetical protein
LAAQLVSVPLPGGGDGGGGGTNQNLDADGRLGVDGVHAAEQGGQRVVRLAAEEGRALVVGRVVAVVQGVDVGTSQPELLPEEGRPRVKGGGQDGVGLDFAFVGGADG